MEFHFRISPTMADNMCLLNIKNFHFQTITGRFKSVFGIGGFTLKSGRACVALGTMPYPCKYVYGFCSGQILQSARLPDPLFVIAPLPAWLHVTWVGYWGLSALGGWLFPCLQNWGQCTSLIFSVRMSLKIYITSTSAPSPICVCILLSNLDGSHQPPISS